MSAERDALETRRGTRSRGSRRAHLRSCLLRLTDEHSIFLTRDGRISIAGLNDGNVESVARAIHAVTDGQKLGG